MNKVGVFWIYDGTIFGKSVSIDSGIEGVPGFIDSPDNHADVWEFERPWAQVSKELSSIEYQDISRGRVLFLSEQNKSLIYADKNLFNTQNKQLISSFFEFKLEDAIWKADAHYTISKNDIDRLFDELK